MQDLDGRKNTDPQKTNQDEMGTPRMYKAFLKVADRHTGAGQDEEGLRRTTASRRHSFKTGVASALRDGSL
jgi:hypothetical protein